MLVGDRKYLVGLKIFATIALVCTLILWGGLWISSATPGTQSGSNTQTVTNKIDSTFDFSSKFNAKIVTQNIVLTRPSDAFLFSGQSEQLSVSFLPANTLDKDVYFRSDDEQIATVDENGVMTCLKAGNTKVYVYLKSNPAVYNFVDVSCYGQNPKDTPLNSLTLPESVKVGQSVQAAINDGNTSPVCATFESSDESVAKVCDGLVYGISVGEARITASFEDGKEASATVRVSENPDFVTPEKIVFKQNPTLIHNVEGQLVSDIVETVEPSGASTDFIVTSSNEQLVRIVSGEFYVEDSGTVELTYASVFNPDLRASVVVTLKKNPPTELRVSGKDVITPNSTTQYTATHMPTPYATDVKWEVVRGNATISESGALVAKSYGKVVVRCTSTVDPALSVEKTIEVKLFSNTYEMVRKFMGHGGLSAILGFGIFGTLFLLCKRKEGVLLAPPLCFVYAGVSEGIQYFTPGRFCATTDVLVDSIGCLIGIAAAIVAIAIVLVIWRLSNKKSFATLAYAYKNLSFATLLKKTYKFDEQYLREPSLNDLDKTDDTDGANVKTDATSVASNTAVNGGDDDALSSAACDDI